MKIETIKELTAEFEANTQKTDDGIEFWLARELQHLLGYTEWRNFENVIKRALSIIKHKHLDGNIVKIKTQANIGSSAVRMVVNYRFDKSAYMLVNELATSFKLNNFYSVRNETVVLGLVKKYCEKKDFQFSYQYRLNEFIYDFLVGPNVLIEFDEPHHKTSFKQRKIDTQKNELAKQEGFTLIRVTLDMDIVDIIIMLEMHL